MYSKAAMDHFLRPRHAGPLVGFGVLTGEATNAECGDTVRFFVQVADGRVTAARFQSTGCAGAIAACSVTAEWLHGRDCREAADLEPGTIEALLAPWPAAKQGCTAMAAAAVRTALAGVRSQ